MPSAVNAVVEEPEISPANDTLRSPPPDWPPPSAIDLSVRDLPYDSSTLEWWYVNSRFEIDQECRLSLFAMFLQRLDTREMLDRWTVVSDPQGRSRWFVDARLEPCAHWRNTRSCVEYPIGWQLDVPSASLFLYVTACFADQEVIASFSEPRFWEGRVNVLGSYHGHAAVGLGWVEWSGVQGGLRQSCP